MHPPSPADTPPPAAVTCRRCATTAEQAPLTWSTAVEGRGQDRRVVHYCERCSRENVRAIEGRLDDSWW